MAKEIDIPGGKAVIRDASEMRGRDRNLIKAAGMSALSVIQRLPDEAQAQQPGESVDDYNERVNKEIQRLDLTRGDAMALLELQESTVIACLQDWTLNLPLPNIDTVGDLPADLYDALIAAVGASALQTISSAIDLNVQPPGENPTGSSKSSDLPSKDGAQSQSTPSLPRDTAATAGDESSA